MVMKKMTPDLHETLNISVKVVNLIKSQAMNSRRFKKMCEEMGSTHIQLMLHTEVRWLLRGRVLTRLLELKDEVKYFLSKLKSGLVIYFEDEVWIFRLAYLAGICKKFNDLNLQLQGFDKNIFKAREKVKEFIRNFRFGLIVLIMGMLQFSQLF
jgi:hypothetical protein